MNKWVKNFVEYAPDCKYVIILSSQSKISQFLFLGRKQVSEQPSRNVTVERCGNLRSENVTWEHLINKAICEASNLFLSNTHESLVVMIYLLPGTLLEKLHGNISGKHALYNSLSISLMKYTSHFKLFKLQLSMQNMSMQGLN